MNQTNHPQPKSKPPNKIVRECLATFDDETIRNFCMDNFPHIYRQLKSVDGRDEIIRQIISYCNQRSKVEELWAYIAQEDRNIYQKFYPKWKQAIGQ